MQIVVEVYFGNNPEDMCAHGCEGCDSGAEAGCRGHLMEEPEVISGWEVLQEQLRQQFAEDDLTLRYVDTRTVAPGELPPKVDQLERIGFLYPYVLLNDKPLLVGSMDSAVVVNNIQKLKAMH